MNMIQPSHISEKKAGNPDDDLKGTYTYDYPRPAVTSDCVIFGFDGRSLKILLVERGIEPYRGYWALPGGFMRMDETIEDCARRELREETGLQNVYLEQFRVFSEVMRDPRGRVITVAFIALVRPEAYRVVGGDDASSAAWFDASMLPPLAFDHTRIITEARAYLKELLRVRAVAFNLLSETFSVDELRRVYEVINGTSYDRRNFTRKLMQADIVEEDCDVCEPCCEAAAPTASCNRNVSFPASEQSGVPEPEAPQAKPSRGKRFRLRSLFSGKDASDSSRKDDEGSIKDLFNF